MHPPPCFRSIPSMSFGLPSSGGTLPSYRDRASLPCFGCFISLPAGAGDYLIIDYLMQKPKHTLYVAAAMWLYAVPV